MAYVSGTATDYNDLLARLEVFLTTNADLVLAGQEWTTLRYSNGPSAQAYPFSRVAFGQVGSATFLDLTTGVFPTSNFKLRVFGTITIPVDGDYTFAVDSGDAGEVLVDGESVVGWYGVHAASAGYTHTGTVPLLAGTYSFEARLATATTSYGLSVAWQKPGDGGLSVISTELAGLQLQWASNGSVPASGAAMAALWTEKELIIKAPGLSGTEDIYLGIQPYQSVSGDYYNWRVAGMVGYYPAETFDNQPGLSPPKYMCLWNSTIPYWFIANGQRVIVVTKVSTTYQMCYLGKFLPYALPSEYPYPVVVAGTYHSPAVRWSSSSYDIANFSNPGTGMAVYYVDGLWKSVRNRVQYSTPPFLWDGQSGIGYNINVWPMSELPDTSPLTSSLSWPDNSYTLLPLILHSSSASSMGANVLGELEGVFWLSGHQNASENTVTIGGDTYLCVQNVDRTGAGDYTAVRLA